MILCCVYQVVLISLIDFSNPPPWLPFVNMLTCPDYFIKFFVMDWLVNAW